ncbi:MAG TPA: putative sulfate exporter family transporter [Chloroflexota bacterium]|nr:putative sulfate exporter family transporter [Chloroflexota bacterium]
MLSTPVSASTQSPPSAPRASQTPRLVAPGLLVALGIGSAATVLGHLAPVVGGAVFALVIGVLVRVGWTLPASCEPGVRYASKRVLQWAIILLGAGLSLRQVWTTGSQSLLVMLGTLIGGMAFILWLGRRIGIDRTLTRLIAAGTSICGASAIGAVAPVLEAESGMVAYAISTVFLFNLAAVLLFPPIGHALHFSQHGFGLWAGTAVNDTSSVVAAAYTYGSAAGSYAVVVKLTRTVMIIPVTLLFAALAARERRKTEQALGQAAKVALPYFIVWFLAASALNTVGAFNRLGPHVLPSIGQFLIVVALAGVGLSTDIPAMRRAGFAPILLGGAGWILIAVLSVALQKLTHSG